MTVVIFRDGVMAADSGAFLDSGFIVSTTFKKVIRTPEGCLVAGSGDWKYIHRFREWAMKGFPASEKPPAVTGGDVGMIVAYPDGRVLQYGEDMIPEDCSDQPWACEGIGQDFANALGTLGWSAERIVAHMIEHYAWAAGEVYALKLEVPAPETAGDDEQPLFVDGLNGEDAVESRGFLVERGLGGTAV